MRRRTTSYRAVASTPSTEVLEPSESDSILDVASILNMIETVRKSIPLHDCPCHAAGLYKFDNMRERIASDRTTLLVAEARVLVKTPSLSSNSLLVKQNFEEILRLSGARTPEWCPGTLNSLILDYFDLSLIGLSIPWLKWHTVCVAASILSQPLPPCPKALREFLPDSRPGYFLRGAAFLFVSQRMKRQRRSDRTFAWTLIQSKGAFPAPDLWYVDQECRNTFADLTTAPAHWIPSARQLDHPRNFPCCARKKLVTSWGSLQPDSKRGSACEPLELPDGTLRGACDACEVYQGDHDLLSRLMENVRRVAAEFRKEMPACVFMDEPSQSGHYSSPIKAGGGMGALAGFTDDRVLEPCTCCRYSWVVDGNQEIVVAHEHLCEYDLGPAEWFYSLQPEARNFATIVGLPEPFKVRPITKGQPVRYYLLRVVQKQLFRAMRAFPVFRLTNEPVVVEAFSQLGFLRPDEKFISGDYKNATNKLSSFLSEIFVEEAFPEKSTQDLVRDSLTGHTLEYESPKQVIDPTFLTGNQANGQLMGSVTSFPVLCAVNFAMWLTGLEFARGAGVGYDRQSAKFHLSKGRVLINGDDIVFPGNSSHSEFWARCASLGGLELSVGKSFESPDWLSVNSEYFDYAPPAEVPDTGFLWEDDSYVASRWYRPGCFIPFGTFFSVASRGMGKVAAGELLSGGDDSLWSLSDRFNYTVRCAPPHLRDELFTLFLNRHPELHCKSEKYPEGRCPAGVSWFLPKELGGLGFNHPGQVSEVQLRYAFLRIANKQPPPLAVGSGRYLQFDAAPPLFSSDTLEELIPDEAPLNFSSCPLDHLAMKFRRTNLAKEWFLRLARRSACGRLTAIPGDLGDSPSFGLTCSRPCGNCPFCRVCDKILIRGDLYSFQKLVDSFQETESSRTMREFLLDHREWMAIASRQTDLVVRLSPEGLWKRRWNIERIRVSSHPAPIVSVDGTLRGKRVPSPLALD